MARQSRPEEVFEMLRTRITRAVSDAAGAGRSGAASSQKRVQGVIDDLRKLADELEGRIRGGSTPAKRSTAAKKAATTRARKATARSSAAKKGAATRKAKASSSSGRKSAASKSSGTTRKAGGTRKASGTRKRTTSSRTKKS